MALIQLQATSFKMSLVRYFSAKFGMQGSFPKAGSRPKPQNAFSFRTRVKDSVSLAG